VKAKARVLMSLKIWMVFYPSITLFYFFFGKHLAALPLHQRAFVLTISLVPWMMFIGVLLIDFLNCRLKGDVAKAKIDRRLTRTENTATRCLYKANRNCAQLNIRSYTSIEQFNKRKYEKGKTI
jgi:hypothetical protein